MRPSKLWNTRAGEFNPNVTLELSGVSGTASVGSVILSLTLALSGVLGTGAVGNAHKRATPFRNIGPSLRRIGHA